MLNKKLGIISFFALFTFFTFFTVKAESTIVIDPDTHTISIVTSGATNTGTNATGDVTT